jgi:hypothetical protein
MRIGRMPPVVSVAAVRPAAQCHRSGSGPPFLVSGSVTAQNRVVSISDAEREAAAAFLTGHPDALRIFEAVVAALDGVGPVTVRTTRSQVAFASGRQFAWIWLPGRWLRKPAAETVLSIGLGRDAGGGRFKEVVQVARGRWMHHLELSGPNEIDAQVRDWLAEAWTEVARPRKQD